MSMVVYWTLFLAFVGFCGYIAVAAVVEGKPEKATPTWCQCFACGDTCTCNACNWARGETLFYRQTQECPCKECQSAPLERPERCLHA
jgi:hypothetical protein